MQTSTFLHSRTLMLGLVVLAIVIGSVVFIQSYSSAPSLSSRDTSSQNLTRTADGLSVTVAHSTSLGVANSSVNLQDQSNASVQVSGHLQGQAAASPQTSNGVEQSTPQTDMSPGQ
jgi:hypothetical protein